MIVLSLGTNMASRWGEPVQTLVAARTVLSQKGIHVLAYSSFYESTPYGFVNQPIFLNAVAAIASALPPHALLGVIKSMEKSAGRRASPRWGPRPLDLDILDYHGRVMSPAAGYLGDNSLVLPHPGIVHRAFVIVPLAEILPNWHHPITGQSAQQLVRGARARAAQGQILRRLG
jgi:2-amino-4-hydroxy-6-hydroxymethyldihydropteridine diphosphokinase